MTELEVMRVLGALSMLAVLFPIFRFGFKLWRVSKPRTIVFMDSDGKVIREFTADSVRDADTKELVRLHDRVRHNDITISTAA